MMTWTTVSVTRRKVLYTLLWFFHIRIDEAVHVRYCDVYVQDNSKDIEKQRLLKEKARQQKEEAQKRLMTFHDLQNRKPLRRKKQPVPVEATAPTEFADIALKKMIVVFVNKPKGGPKKRRYVAIPEGCVAFEFLKSVCGRTDERYLFPYRGWDDRVPMSTKTARNWMHTDFAIHMNEMTGKKPSPAHDAPLVGSIFEKDRHARAPDREAARAREEERKVWEVHDVLVHGPRRYTGRVRQQMAVAVVT